MGDERRGEAAGAGVAPGASLVFGVVQGQVDRQALMMDIPLECRAEGCALGLRGRRVRFSQEHRVLGGPIWQWGGGRTWGGPGCLRESGR